MTPPTMQLETVTQQRLLSSFTGSQDSRIQLRNRTPTKHLLILQYPKKRAKPKKYKLYFELIMVAYMAEIPALQAKTVFCHI